MAPASSAERSQEEGQGVEACGGRYLATPGPADFLRVLLL